MLTSVRLERFRGFDDQVIPTSAITVLLGPNSCGKTSVLNAIRFATAALRRALEEEQVLARSSQHFRAQLSGWPHHRWMPAAALVELELHATRDDLTQGFAIELTFSADDAVRSTRVEVDENLLCSVTFDCPALAAEVAKRAERPADLTDLTFVRADLLRRLLDRLPRALFLPAFYGITQDEEYRTSATVARLLESAEQSRIVRNLVARLSGPEFARLNAFLSQTVKATLVSRTSQLDVEQVEHLAVKFRDTDGELELASGGTGFVALVALYAALQQEVHERRAERTLILLLDEPEAHLHPSLQAQIADTLADLASEFGAQLVLATHSVEMINRLGRRGDDTVLLAVDRSRQRVAALHSEEERLGELASFCDLAPFSSLQLLRERRILFYEGPSDKDILDGCAQLLFRSQPGKLERYRRWVSASLSGVDNAAAADLLQRALRPLFVAAPATDAVRIIRVLDHDLQREARFGPWSKPRAEGQGTVAMTQLDVVWSRYSIESLFLDADHLLAWLRLITQGSELKDEELARLVTGALESARVDEKLFDKGITHLARLRREQAEESLRMRRTASGDEDARINMEAIEKNAYLLAKSALRDHPEVWQHGRDRARAILGALREQLPQGLKAHFPVSIQKLVRHRWLRDRVGTLSQIEALIPEEIRRLIDEMAMD